MYTETTLTRVPFAPLSVHGSGARPTHEAFPYSFNFNWSVGVTFVVTEELERGTFPVPPDELSMPGSVQLAAGAAASAKLEAVVNIDDVVVFPDLKQVRLLVSVLSVQSGSEFTFFAQDNL